MKTGSMPAEKTRDAQRDVRSAKCEVRAPRTPRPAPRTAHPARLIPRVFTYRHVVERLVESGVEGALLDAACLMEAASGIPRWRLILDPEQPIPSDTARRLESMLSRREAQEPIAYILGVKEFWSLPLAVSPDVLIPRPETETLVEAVLEKVRGVPPHPSLPLGGGRGGEGVPSAVPSHLAPGTSHAALTIVDLGTGCGAIALALAVEVPHARIYALDRSPGACRIARRNALALGLTSRVRCVQGDLCAPLRMIETGGGCDLIVSNPPYIASGALTTLSPEITAYEPLEALDGGPDGLRYYRRIIEEAPAYLREGGWLALEIGDDQAPAVMGLIRQADAFGEAQVKADLAGRDRVVLAPRRGRTHG